MESGAIGNCQEASLAAVEIIPMRGSDLDAVCSLENRAFRTPWDRKSFEMAISDSRLAALVIRRSGVFSGYLVAVFREHELLIANLVIAKEFRREGLASRLLEHIFQIALGKGMTYAVLDVRASNLGAINLYKQFGFRVIGKRRDYYSSPPEDGLIMYRSL